MVSYFLKTALAGELFVLDLLQTCRVKRDRLTPPGNTAKPQTLERTFTWDKQTAGLYLVCCFLFLQLLHHYVLLIIVFLVRCSPHKTICTVCRCTISVVYKLVTLQTGYSRNYPANVSIVTRLSWIIPGAALDGDISQCLVQKIFYITRGTDPKVCTCIYLLRWIWFARLEAGHLLQGFFLHELKAVLAICSAYLA